MKESTFSKFIRNGTVLTNIPVVFFSTKLVLFNIGVPNTKSFKPVVLLIYKEYIAVIKLKTEILFCLQKAFIEFIVSLLIL